MQANWKMTSQVLGLPPFEITCTLPNFKVLFPYIKPVASDVHQQLLTGVKSAATTFKSDHEVSGEISSQIFLSKNNFIAEWQILFSDPDCGGVTGMPCLSRPGICRATTRGHRWLRGLRGLLPESSRRKGTLRDREGRYVYRTCDLSSADFWRRWFSKLGWSLWFPETLGLTLISVDSKSP